MCPNFIKITLVVLEIWGGLHYHFFLNIIQYLLFISWFLFDCGTNFVPGTNYLTWIFIQPFYKPVFKCHNVVSTNQRVPSLLKSIIWLLSWTYNFNLITDTNGYITLQNDILYGRKFNNELQCIVYNISIFHYRSDRPTVHDISCISVPVCIKYQYACKFFQTSVW